MMLTVAHKINRKRWDRGKPWKRTTIAQLRTAERRVIAKERAVKAIIGD
ncbi:hypothetical protein [Sphingobium olei]|uniref:Integrase n=1 Tax=Sphingobium olei TaxID=420955 RepID=A0ABW3NZ75_9SPHN